MSSNILNFWWDVPDTGFYWTDAPALPDRPGKRLTTGLPMEVGGPVRRYQPFDDAKLSGLFRQFAATEPTEAGILSFASAHGCLLDPREQDTVRFTPDTDEPYYGFGEPFELWRAQIQLMQMAVSLWDAASSSDVRWIRERMVIQPEQRELKPGEMSSGPMRVARYVSGDLAGPDLYLDFELERVLTPFDFGRLARLYVQQLVNTALEEHISPRVLYDPRTDRWELRLRPANLLGAMWLQLAQAIDGNKKFRSCRECGTWFELDPQKNRTSKYYCSNACRSKALRERVARARHLYHEKGWTLDQIANELDSTPDVVQGWVSKNG